MDYENHKMIFIESKYCAVEGKDYRELYFELMKVRKELQESKNVPRNLLNTIATQVSKKVHRNLLNTITTQGIH